MLGKKNDIKLIALRYFYLLSLVTQLLSYNNKNPVTISSIVRKSSLINGLKLISLVSIINSNNANAKDNDNQVLGVDKSGLLKACITSEECVSSQDDRPFCFLPPWGYEGSMINAKQKLISQLEKMKECDILYNNDDDNDNNRYIKAQFLDSSKNIDEVEFYFTLNDYTIQFRSYRKTSNPLNNQLAFFNNNSNRNRLEKLRLKLGFEEIEVIRNRRRVLLFGESPFDTFGPPTIEFEEIIDNISGDMSSSIKVITNDNIYPYPIWESKLT